MAERIWAIDFARGIAILMMAWFHFLFDIDYLHYAEIALYSGFWGLFQKATISLFLLLVGISIAITYSKRKDYFLEHMLKRSAFLFFMAMLITAVTAILFPQNAIYFGIIHMISVSLLVSIPFAGKKMHSLIAGLLLILIPVAIDISGFNMPLLLWAGFSMPMPTFDFVPMVPWLGIVLIGIAVWGWMENAVKKIKMPVQMEFASETVSFLGRNSLAIYLIHQPIIFGTLFLLKSAGM